MQFVDEATIEVQAGKGGAGALSFHRARNLPRGGPDGGNGGNGGSVYLVGDHALNTLVDFRFMPRRRAEDGRPGGSGGKKGASGTDLAVRVPVGTAVADVDTRGALGDVEDEGERMLVARGGRRGLGNAHFKSSTSRAPRRTTPGMPGERRRLRLELRVIADVGLLGMPNAGKSTLVGRVSAARPKVAPYPFTTLVPNLGTVRVGHDGNPEGSFVMADVPGLVPGAAAGAGLGARFLKHLSRTRLLLHLVDCAPTLGDPIDNARAIEAELFAFSEAFRERAIWMVATKADLPAAGTVLARLEETFPDRPCYAVSALAGQGVAALLGAIMRHVAERRRRLATDAAFALAERRLAERIGDDVRQRGFESKADPNGIPGQAPAATHRRG